MRHIKFIVGIVVYLLSGIAFTGCLLTSCDDWTDPETVGLEVKNPEEQNPELYAKYTANVRTYKQQTHYRVFARFPNGNSGNGEKDFLRSLPDSLDCVILTNANKLSAYDLEDIPHLQQQFGTSVLYGIDLTSQKEEIEKAGGDLQKQLATYLDQVVANVKEHNLDGISLSYEGNLDTGSDEAQNEIIAAMRTLVFSKLSPLMKDGKVLFFEGNPTFVPKDEQKMFSYYILNTTEVADIFALKLQVSYANEFVGIPLDKLVISADPDLFIKNSEDKNIESILYLTKQVISCGPLAGIAIYNMPADYYHVGKNYVQTCNAIRTLNPSPIK
ncbi:glycoside hydrolase family 18 [Bacteroides faecium]|uniref:Uncharacterized protein n=1 Tax=Bacteroides faecium TaxID=2715212 RepID=A0A6H0KSN6_9BACE|nr:glycoside hydrolase family 18 [Bacteroides faecium]QIU96476.1 hypothetical protein BacF7301_20990 [Bacteroides faecium]